MTCNALNFRRFRVRSSTFHNRANVKANCAEAVATPSVPMEPVHVSVLTSRRLHSVDANISDLANAALLIDKPLDWTSFDACRYIRKLLWIKKVGHAGTLDPKATGLLVICVGKATKLVDTYQGMDKTYTGVIRLGEATPSFDVETEVDVRMPWEHLTDEDLTSAAASLTGDLQQLPPMYSAIRIKGEKLYHKARRGEEVVRQVRAIRVSQFDVWRQPGAQDVSFRIVCSKGTYVRTLAHDLGTALGSAGHLMALRREAIGDLNVADAVQELGELVNGLKKEAGTLPPRQQRQEQKRTAAAAQAAEAAAAEDKTQELLAEAGDASDSDASSEETAVSAHASSRTATAAVSSDASSEETTVSVHASSQTAAAPSDASIEAAAASR